MLAELQRWGVVAGVGVPRQICHAALPRHVRIRPSSHAVVWVRATFFDTGTFVGCVVGVSVWLGCGVCALSTTSKPPPPSPSHFRRKCKPGLRELSADEIANGYVHVHFFVPVEVF